MEFNPRIQFDFPEEIQIEYAPLAEAAIKTFNSFQDQMESVTWAYKILLEENIKLKVKIQALEKDTKPSSQRLHDNEVLSTNYFSEKFSGGATNDLLTSPKKKINQC